MSVNSPDISMNDTNIDNLGVQCLNGVIYTSLTHFGLFFYINNPYDHMTDDAKTVRNYEVWASPVLALLVVLEQLIRFFQRKQSSRIADIIVNTGSALFFIVLRVFLLGVVVSAFIWVYDNYRLVTLPIDSLWTWFLSFLLVEFLYYWTHRAFHEINILWATHQYHHMAEDISVTAAIRNSIVDLICFDAFPIPLALIIPPPILTVHIQFVLLCQLWVHNDVIPKLWPLEYVINTASNHRVHHGRNRYCIDKNYSALLMVWDHMFGTYQEEKEKIIFGVVSPHPKTFNMFTLQFGYYKNVWNKFMEVEGIGNKLSAIFKGPGWSPGKPRLGLLEDIPEPDPDAPKYTYDPFIPLWHKIYVSAHGFILFYGIYIIADHELVRDSILQVFLGMAYILYALVAFGSIFDKKPYAPLLEIIRCILYLLFDFFVIAKNPWSPTQNVELLAVHLIWFLRAFHIFSIILWTIRYIFYREAVYIVQSTLENKFHDIEKVQIKQFGSRCTIIWLFFGFFFASIMLLIPYTLDVKECSQLYNKLSIK